jgi:hypothetical protein
MLTASIEERLLEWASTVGSGTVDSFRDAHSWAHESTDRAQGTRALTALERLCHVDIDWPRGRWWTTPSALAAIDGLGGNCLLVGARTRHTLAALGDAQSAGTVEITRIPQPGPAPDATYVQVPTDEVLHDLADQIGAVVVAEGRRVYRGMLSTLDDVLSSAEERFTASGLQARRLDPATMKFEPVEVRGGRWYPGCFEQSSRGLRRFLFVDDDGALHNVDRQVAIHAEIRRARRRDERVHAGGAPLAWDQRTERLVCSVRARLPLMHERAAVLCSGLLPGVQDVDLHGEQMPAFIYEGVAATTFKRIIETLDYPPAGTSVPVKEAPQ